MAGKFFGAIALLGAAGSGALAQSAPDGTVRAPDNNPPSGWPAATVLIAPPGQPEPTDVVWSWVSGAGMVEATRATTAGIGQPLPAASSGRAKSLDACKLAAWGEAAKMGARDIEAVPAGPQRTDRWGRITGPIHLRITYAGPFVYTIKEDVMTCTVDRKGNLAAGS